MNTDTDHCCECRGPLGPTSLGDSHYCGDCGRGPYCDECFDIHFCDDDAPTVDLEAYTAALVDVATAARVAVGPPEPEPGEPWWMANLRAALIRLDAVKAGEKP
jgi:hypothetical protein